MQTIPLEHRTLHAPDGSGPFALALMRPEQATRAVLLLPAIAGIDGYIAERAAHLAAEGYAVAVLDYYRGSGHKPDLSTPERIGAAVAALDDAGVMRDMALAFDWLATQGFGAGETAMLGFCIGGAFAILASAAQARAACAVAYYGQLRSPAKPIDPIAIAARIGAPLLAHIGERDRLIAAKDVAEFSQATRDAAAPVEVHTYPGAPHAFDEWHRPAVFRPVASAEAWQRTLTFLHWHLTHTTRRPT